MVKSAKTVKFLRDNFHPDQAAWIGLQYFCRFRKLMWVTGEVHPLNGFKYWGKPWKTAFGCTNLSLEVYFFAVAKGFRWHAHVFAKECGYYFVEYPKKPK